jgi:prepilin-type N-terminal cleavage/methylation domain-containing protein
VTNSPDKNSMIVRHIRPLIDRVQTRLAGEEGFTLVELMITLLTIGILMTVAVPTFLSFKDRAAKAGDNFPGSRNDPDADNANTGFLGISLTGLAKYDASLVASTGIIVNPAGWNGNASSATDFCLTATMGRWVAVQHGADTAVTVGTLFTPATCTVS